MEVRCTGCNKLFRVSDEKITGLGIKFPCSGCGVAVKITSEDFEQYKLSREAASALASFEPKPPKPSAAPAAGVQESELEVWKSGDPSPNADFDLSDPATAAAAMHQEEEAPLFVMPDVPAEPVRPAPAPEPLKTEPKPAPKPAPAPPVPPARVAPAASAAPAPEAPKVQPKRPAPAPARPAQPDMKVAPRPAAPVRPASVPPSPAARPKAPDRPAHVNVSAVPDNSMGNGTKAAIVVAALIVLTVGAYFAKSFFGGKSPSGNASQHAIEMGKEVTPEGLHIINASGGVDPVSGDLIISGVIENATDNPRPAWYVVVDLLDAQGTTVTQAKLVSGKHFYTRRDLEILGKRGTNIQELKTKQLQEQGIVIPARGSVSFEIRVLEPPVGVSNFNANLQPFDPVKLYKEMSEAQK